MPPAENTPDFDKMSPEEIMAWMESLAKRQGADAAQFTTSADVEIAEIDPDSVVIDEPGYVPSEGKMKGKKIETIMPSKSTAPKPAAAPTKPPPAAVAAPPPPPVPAPAAQPPAASAPPPPQSAEKQSEPEGASALSWLESLAADQGGDFPSLDLSSIAADLAPAAASPTPEAETTNPVDWLENLAQSQGVENVTPAEPVSAESSDPMSWLESLAKRQGAPDEELTTSADLDIPMPENAGAEGPGYTDYTFETPDAALKQPELNIPAAPSAAPVPVGESSDPAAWLDALATSTGAPEPKSSEPKMSDDEIQHALAKGQLVPHDQMEAWMNRQLQIGAERPEPEELSAFDPDAPPVKAELPDWLLEQVGEAPPPEEATRPVPPPTFPPALIDAIVEPPPAANIPDWLKEETPAHGDLENIFAAPEPTSAASASAANPSAIEIDPNDPWVEALELEYVQGKGGVAAPPPAAPSAPAAALQDAALQPETELPAGEPEAMPDWLQGVVSTPEPVEDIPGWLTADINQPTPVAVTPAIPGEEIPDWLKAVDIEAAEVPGWLTETLGTASEEVTSITPTPASASAPVPVPAAPVPAIVPASRVISPAPIPARVTMNAADAQNTLNNARSQANANNIEGCLQNYEVLIRANAELDAAVGDLIKLVDKIKTSPAVYRVLGDGLMRQGKLQAALDIYRKALNQL